MLVATLTIKVKALRATGKPHTEAYQNLLQWADATAVAQLDLSDVALLLHHLSQAKKNGMRNSRESISVVKWLVLAAA